MKSRLAPTILTIVVSGLLLSNFLPLSKVESKTQQITQSTAGPLASDNLPKTLTLTEAQKAIPDEAAFEVFLRTVGENNARELLLKVGLDEVEDSDELYTLMDEARSFANRLKQLDEQAKNVKLGNDGGKTALTTSKGKATLANLDRDKRNILDEITFRYLRSVTSSENPWKKLQEYVRTTVKSQMSVVDVKSSKRLKPSKDRLAKMSLGNSFSAGSSVQTQVGNAYLYIDGWNTEDNFFGSAMITEQYASGTSYLVSVTTTSPGGRNNSTAVDGIMPH